MEDKKLTEGQKGANGDQQDCGCDGNCCPPKKNKMIGRIIFLIVVLAAIGIIAIKLFNGPVAKADNPACCPQESSASCDSSKTLPCDTTKESSCCPKK